jgi:hypothetical protein
MEAPTTLQPLTPAPDPPDPTPEPPRYLTVKDFRTMCEETGFPHTGDFKALHNAASIQNHDCDSLKVILQTGALLAAWPDDLMPRPIKETRRANNYATSGLRRLTPDLVAQWYYDHLLVNQWEFHGTDPPPLRPDSHSQMGFLNCPGKDDENLVHVWTALAYLNGRDQCGSYSWSAETESEDLEKEYERIIGDHSDHSPQERSNNDLALYDMSEAGLAPARKMAELLKTTDGNSGQKALYNARLRAFQNAAEGSISTLKRSDKAPQPDTTTWEGRKVWLPTTHTPTANPHTSKPPTPNPPHKQRLLPNEAMNSIHAIASFNITFCNETLEASTSAKERAALGEFITRFSPVHHQGQPAPAQITTNSYYKPTSHYPVLHAQPFALAKNNHFNPMATMDSMADLPGPTRLKICRDPSQSTEGQIIGEIDQSSAGYGATCAWAIWSLAPKSTINPLLEVINNKHATRKLIAMEWGDRGSDSALSSKGKARIKADGGYFSPITLNHLRPTGFWKTKSTTQTNIRKASYLSIQGVFWADILGPLYKSTLSPASLMRFCITLEETQNTDTSTPPTAPTITSHLKSIDALSKGTPFDPDEEWFCAIAILLPRENTGLAFYQDTALKLIKEAPREVLTVKHKALLLATRIRANQFWEWFTPWTSSQTTTRPTNQPLIPTSNICNRAQANMCRKHPGYASNQSKSNNQDPLPGSLTGFLQATVIQPALGRMISHLRSRFPGGNILSYNADGFIFRTQPNPEDQSFTTAMSNFRASLGPEEPAIHYEVNMIAPATPAP